MFYLGYLCCFSSSVQTATKQSKWDMPEELLLLLEKVGKEAGPSPTSVLLEEQLPTTI
jgi:hypothetical protein